jgi:hypothetical protein
MQIDHDSMMVVVENFSNMAHFIPCKKTNDANKLVVLFFREIVKLHGLPKSIISEKDTIFLGNFRRKLWKNMHSKLLDIFAYHPPMDGQTKVVN